jgi:hypothetical protein
LAVRAPELAQVVALEKYGMPPLVPAIVNAGVVVPVATVTMPPVHSTLVTVPVPAGRSPEVKARNAGAPAVANSACVVVLSAAVTVGVAPAPPPSTTPLAVRAPELAQVVALEKYGMPPDVPAIVNAGVVVPVATVTIPPVHPTEVTYASAGRSLDASARNAGAPAVANSA